MAKTVQKTKEKKSGKKNVKVDAKFHLERALKINPKFLDAHYELGCLLRDEGDLKGAEKQYKEVIKLNNNHADGYFQLALLAAEFKKNKLARDNFEKAVTIKFDDSEIQFKYGLFLKKIKKIEEATEHFSKAIESNQNFSEAYFELAMLLRDPEDYDQAKKNYETAIDIQPDYVDALYYLGKLVMNGLKKDNDGTLLWQPEKDYAISCFNKILKTDENHAKANLRLGMIYVDQEEYEKAEKHLKKAVKQNSRFSKALYQLGLVSKELKKAKDEKRQQYDNLRKSENTYRIFQDSSKYF